MRSLAARRQATTVTDAAIASEVHQPLDGLLNVAPQVAFHFVLLVNDIANPYLFLGSQIVTVPSRIDLCLGEKSLRQRPPDPIDVGQRDLHPFMMGQLNARDTCHALNLHQPWRCLWRGLGHKMRTTPLRRTTLQFLQILFTDARTFIKKCQPVFSASGM
jgi:hypothetical protein